MARSLPAILVAITLAFAVFLPAGATTATPVAAQPNWAELTPQQRQTLAPLAEEWDTFPAVRRKKWLGIAKRYPAMTPEQQQRVQAQMKPWANLSPEERSTARKNFKRKKPVVDSPQQREARRKKWEQYQALPEDEKMKLRENAARKKLAPQAKPYISRPLTQPAPARSGSTAAR